MSNLPVHLVLKQGEWLKLEVVSGENSTVSGRGKYEAEDQGEDWVDIWRRLIFERAWKDGAPRVQDGIEAGNWFGRGCNEGLTCGEYLHVPFQEEEEDRSFRIRSSRQPGDCFPFKPLPCSNAEWASVENPEPESEMNASIPIKTQPSTKFDLPEIMLEVLQVHVCRVQEVARSACNAVLFAGALVPLSSGLTAVDVLAERWDSLHLSIKEKWKANPWVWALLLRSVQR